MFSAKAWEQVEGAFKGSSEHTFDLMALDLNAQLGKNGLVLPHFTPCGSPHSKGINLFVQDLTESEHDLSNMYVYPPFCLTGPVSRFLSQCRRPFTTVVPGGHPRAYWWPRLMVMCSEVLCLAEEGDHDTVFFSFQVGISAKFVPGAAVSMQSFKILNQDL